FFAPRGAGTSELGLQRHLSVTPVRPRVAATANRSTRHPGCAGQARCAGDADYRFEIRRHFRSRLGYRIVGMKINMLVLDCIPQPLDEHVVAPAPLAAHADPAIV